jgi:hypothetical protein
MNELLRHTVATVAYRGAKALDGASPGFAEFRLDSTSRTPAEILAHMGDLFDWALSSAEGREKWLDSKPLPWDREVARFFAALAAFDARLAETAPLGAPAERLFQGPIADALTHIGQLAMLRRVAGCRMRGENYFVAGIETGKVGPEQAKPVKEF